MYYNSFVFLTPPTDPDPTCKDGPNLLSFKQSVQTAVGFNSKFLSSPVNFFSQQFVKFVSYKNGCFLRRLVDEKSVSYSAFSIRIFSFLKKTDWLLKQNGSIENWPVYQHQASFGFVTVFLYFDLLLVFDRWCQKTTNWRNSQTTARLTSSNGRLPGSLLA